MFTFLLFTAAQAAPPDRHAPPGPPPITHALDAVTLSDEERAAIDTLIRDARPQLDALHTAVHDREQALMEDITALLDADQQAQLRAALPPRDSRPDPR